MPTKRKIQVTKRARPEKVPVILGRRMRRLEKVRDAKFCYLLSIGKLYIRVVPYDFNKRWTFSMYAPELGLNGQLLANADFDTAQRAASEAESVLTRIAIQIATTKPNRKAS